MELQASSVLPEKNPLKYYYYDYTLRRMQAQKVR